MYVCMCIYVCIYISIFKVDDGYVRQVRLTIYSALVHFNSIQNKKHANRHFTLARSTSRHVLKKPQIIHVPNFYSPTCYYYYYCYLYYHIVNYTYSCCYCCFCSYYFNTNSLARIWDPTFFQSSLLSVRFVFRQARSSASSCGCDRHENPNAAIINTFLNLQT